jgi:phage tail protein X
MPNFEKRSEVREMKTYLAPQGAMWDWISWKHYGDEGFIDALLNANSSLRRVVRFEKPTLIIIPEKPIMSPNSVAQLPPWKQGACYAATAFFPGGRNCRR